MNTWNLPFLNMNMNQPLTSSPASCHAPRVKYLSVHSALPDVNGLHATHVLDQLILTTDKAARVK